jgi:protease I
LKEENMADAILENRKIAILATDGFEQSELFEPLRALEKAGADVHIVSLKTGSIRAWNKNDWGESIDVDTTVSRVKADEFDALVLPGGVMNPDKLRIEEKAVEFVKGFASAGKPIAAICHGPWTLIDAGVVVGRTMTSWPSLRTDLTNAGAKWVDEEVVTDNGLVTSRKPADLSAFCDKMIEEFAEGLHEPVMRERASKDHRVEGSFH